MGHRTRQASAAAPDRAHRLAHWWFDAPLHLGPSYDAIEWAASDNRTLITLAALFAVRAIATWVCVGGGGVGGLFIPLVTQGAIVGSFAQELVHPANPTLFPTVGIAAFLGAGYRTPLAGVAVVAEATGSPASSSPPSSPPRQPSWSWAASRSAPISVSSDYPRSNRSPGCPSARS